ncbi:hypothetical protein BC938DRAFT_476942, partial [Jimgerdemannia flammicorona]
NVLRLRDQKQLDFEELSDYLQSAKLEHERTLHPRLAERGMDLRNYINDKINDIRGVDQEKARQDKIVRLDSKIKELEDEVGKSHFISESFSAQVVKEYHAFQQAKAIEMKESLAAYTDAHVEFYKQVGSGGPL